MSAFYLPATTRRLPCDRTSEPILKEPILYPILPLYPHISRDSEMERREGIMGTHAELITTSPLYARLAKLQFTAQAAE